VANVITSTLLFLLMAILIISFGGEWQHAILALAGS
jgi:uncharacterized membrane protein